MHVQSPKWSLARGAVIVALCVPAVQPMALAESNCPRSKISVEKFGVQDEGQITTVITGLILNKCDIPVGVQLKVIFYDKSNNILRVEDMWPASVSNIDAHSDYPFQVHINRVKGFERVEVRVLRAQTW